MNEAVESFCPICGGGLSALHCKLICANCGYREDCTDLFPCDPAGPSRDDSRSAPPPTESPEDRS